MAAAVWQLLAAAVWQLMAAAIWQPTYVVVLACARLLLHASSIQVGPWDVRLRLVLPGNLPAHVPLLVCAAQEPNDVGQELCASAGGL